jgi:hypothetical protein
LGLKKTALHFFPDIYDRLEVVVDPRKRKDYTMTEILLGGLFMFSSKQGSRNSMNLDRENEIFLKNYEKLFGIRLPHMDTINDVLIELDNDELEQLKAQFIVSLIEKKVLKKFRLLDAYHRVAIDGTGVMTVPEGHCDYCLTKKSKNGVVTYFHNILEAKIVTPNGFALSLATEWIENPEHYDKQDCELKAFTRLADKLKKLFPRLPICILADGLYPNKTFFDICKNNEWRHIVTLKDGNLKILWEEIDDDLLISKNNRDSHDKKNSYRWLTNLFYRDHNLSWFECTSVGEPGRFVFVSDLLASYENVIELSDSGRMRFKIENEGFNTQKNGGYAMEHKYSQTSYNASKNYQSLLQIAHMLNQLYILSTWVKPLIDGSKVTIKYLWKRLLGAFCEVEFNLADCCVHNLGRFQIRYE